ncbi:MAG: hypothetical protein HXX13_10315 [Bacteroidetes bacterium]|nr:hypothetical protein [Bacteroidota bacterium]
MIKPLKLPNQSTWLRISIFAIAMGLLEAIVVVYLRELYYPEGFSFPLKAMKPGIFSTELLRELATIVMLITAGMLAGRNKLSRFAWFIYAFAAWDIFYYVFLKLLLDWPESLFTWDILFLIPITWVGPVIAPVINSITMVVLAYLIIEGKIAGLKRFEWFLLITGSLVVIISYTREYASYMLSRFSMHEMFLASNASIVMKHASTFVPGNFNWILFFSGVSLHWLAILSSALSKK